MAESIGQERGAAAAIGAGGLLLAGLILYAQHYLSPDEIQRRDKAAIAGSPAPAVRVQTERAGDSRSRLVIQTDATHLAQTWIRGPGNLCTPIKLSRTVRFSFQDGLSFPLVTPSLPVDGLNGTHTVTINAANCKGRACGEWTKQEVPIVYDSVPPKIIALNFGEISSGKVPMDITLHDDTSPKGLLVNVHNGKNTDTFTGGMSDVRSALENGISLVKGKNELVIEACDAAGNCSSTERTITYDPVSGFRKAKTEVTDLGNGKYRLTGSVDDLYRSFDFTSFSASCAQDNLVRFPNLQKQTMPVDLSPPEASGGQYSIVCQFDRYGNAFFKMYINAGDKSPVHFSVKVDKELVPDHLVISRLLTEEALALFGTILGITAVAGLGTWGYHEISFRSMLRKGSLDKANELLNRNPNPRREEMLQAAINAERMT